MLHDVILARFRFGCFMFVTSLHFLSPLISYKLQMFYSVFGTIATQLSSPSQRRLQPACTFCHLQCLHCYFAHLLQLLKVLLLLHLYNKVCLQEKSLRSSRPLSSNPGVATQKRSATSVVHTKIHFDLLTHKTYVNVPSQRHTFGKGC